MLRAEGIHGSVLIPIQRIRNAGINSIHTDYGSDPFLGLFTDYAKDS